MTMTETEVLQEKCSAIIREMQLVAWLLRELEADLRMASASGLAVPSDRVRGWTDQLHEALTRL